MITGQGIKTET